METTETYLMATLTADPYGDFGKRVIKFDRDDYGNRFTDLMTLQRYVTDFLVHNLDICRISVEYTQQTVKTITESTVLLSIKSH